MGRGYWEEAITTASSFSWDLMLWEPREIASLERQNLSEGKLSLYSFNFFFYNTIRIWSIRYLFIAVLSIPIWHASSFSSPTPSVDTPTPSAPSPIYSPVSPSSPTPSPVSSFFPSLSQKIPFLPPSSSLLQALEILALSSPPCTYWSSLLFAIFALLIYIYLSYIKLPHLFILAQTPLMLGCINTNILSPFILLSHLWESSHFHGLVHLALVCPVIRVFRRRVLIYCHICGFSEDLTLSHPVSLIQRIRLKLLLHMKLF